MKNRKITYDNIFEIITKDKNECWNLNDEFNIKNGRYLTYRFGSFKKRPRHIYWFFVYGKFPKKRIIGICGNKKCVNPHHAIEYNSVFDRFILKIRVEENKRNPCWIWTGSKNKQNYGILFFGENQKSRNVMAHRFSYEYYIGKIPENLIILHSCDNPSCVNPAHLSVGNSQENSLDRDIKGRSSYKLTIEKVKEIREQHNNGKSARKLSKEFKINLKNMYNIVNRKSWKWVK